MSTLERLLTSVGPHVILEILLYRKLPITVPTLEWLVTSVGPYVPIKMVLKRKFPITVPTLEGFLNSVGPHVHDETAFSVKCILTVITLERLSICMGTKVPLEGSQGRAYSAAATTLKRVCMVTSLNMFLDLSNSFTGFTAESTSVGGSVFLLLFSYSTCRFSSETDEKLSLQ